MSETMVERVAKVIFERIARDPDWGDAYLTRAQAQACGNDDYSQEECRDIARAAIEAIREPTKAMCKLAADTEGEGRFSGGYTNWEGGCEAIYTAMIDAALGERDGD